MSGRDAPVRLPRELADLAELFRPYAHGGLQMDAAAVGAVVQRLELLARAARLNELELAEWKRIAMLTRTAKAGSA